MKTEIKKVRLGKKVVDEVEVTIYETVEEILKNEEDKNILANEYYGRKVAIMSKARALHAPKKTGKNARFWIGLESLTPEELISVAGDKAAMEDLVASDDVQARIEEKIAADAPAEDTEE